MPSHEEYNQQRKLAEELRNNATMSGGNYSTPVLNKSAELYNSTTTNLLKSNSTTEVKSADEYWPAWVQFVTCISHLLLAFNCSVNFFIYYIKRRALCSGKFNTSVYRLHTNVLCNLITFTAKVLHTFFN